jgi:hypothetical protein
MVSSNPNIQNQITTLQNKNSYLNYSNSQPSFSCRVHFNTSNYHCKILNIYVDGSYSVDVGCQYAGSNTVSQVTCTTCNGFQFYRDSIIGKFKG